MFPILNKTANEQKKKRNTIKVDEAKIEYKKNQSSQTSNEQHHHAEGSEEALTQVTCE